MEVLYTAKATAKGGRTGSVKTDDGRIDLQLSKPGAGEGVNPEQLFAAGYAACFGGAVQFLAQQKGEDVGDVTVEMDVTLNKVEDGFKLGATINVLLPNLDAAKAREVVEAAHAFCPYSRATRGNIDVVLKVNGQ